MSRIRERGKEGGDHGALASVWSVSGRPTMYRELALSTKFIILGEFTHDNP